MGSESLKFAMKQVDEGQISTVNRLRWGLFELFADNTFSCLNRLLFVVTKG